MAVCPSENDDSSKSARLEGLSTLKQKKLSKRRVEWLATIDAALRRAARDARKTARMYGTPIYVWENGRVVAKKP
jgi:hypothetical protein